MAWLAVNSDGGELISNEKMFKLHKYFAAQIIKNYKNKDLYLNAFVNIKDCYITGTYSGNNGGDLPLGEVREFDYVDLPSGSIQKLTGRTLTWEDDPIELN